MERQTGGLSDAGKEKRIYRAENLTIPVPENSEKPFHMLRHIFATNCISHGFDMKTVSELLGHSNVTTTMRIYVHSDMQRKKMLMADYRMTA